MTAPRPDSPDRSTRQGDTVAPPDDDGIGVPEGLVIPPKPPLPVPPPTAEETDADVSGDLETVTDPAPEAESDGEPGALDVLWGTRDGDEAGEQDAVPALSVQNLRKGFGATTAVADISWDIPAGTFSGIVGPNGAGKTTTLSMIAGLLRPDSGTIRIHGVDIRRNERAAKRLIGVLPDRLRTFDRLTGRQLLAYAGLLRGLPGDVVDTRVTALAQALDLTDALGRVVADYSAGMTKKVMLAAAMIHAPRILVLDEPFEALDPVSAGVILDILRDYTAHGGTVVLSSHGMDLIERVCDRVAVLAAGQIVAEGTVEELRGESTLAERFVEIVGGAGEAEGLEWLHTFSG